MQDLVGPFRQTCEEWRQSSESLSVLVRIRRVRSQHMALGLCLFPLKRERLSCHGEVASAEENASSETVGIYVRRLPVNKKEQATNLKERGSRSEREPVFACQADFQVRYWNRACLVSINLSS